MTKSLEKSMERLAEVTRLQNSLKAEADSLKAEIMKQMVKADEKKLDSEHLSVTYVAATQKSTFDSKKFQEEHPKMYKNFIKTSKVSESLRVALK
jgi:hypothetical protein